MPTPGVTRSRRHAGVDTTRGKWFAVCLTFRAVAITAVAIERAPDDKHDHALDALRYLIARLDQGRLAKSRPTIPDPNDSKPAHESVGVRDAPEPSPTQREQRARLQRNIWNDVDAWRSFS